MSKYSIQIKALSRVGNLFTHAVQLTRSIPRGSHLTHPTSTGICVAKLVFSFVQTNSKWIPDYAGMMR